MKIKDTYKIELINNKIILVHKEYNTAIDNIEIHINERIVKTINDFDNEKTAMYLLDLEVENISKFLIELNKINCWNGNKSICQKDIDETLEMLNL